MFIYWENQYRASAVCILIKTTIELLQQIKKNHCKLYVHCFFGITKERGEITSQKREPLRHEQTFSMSRNFRQNVHHLTGPLEVISMSAPMVPQYNHLFEQPGCILS